VLTVANYNMHCGMDGWGRPYDYLGVIASFGADIIVLEEAWTVAGEEGDGQAERAAAQLGYQVVTQPMGEGRRIRPQPDATDTWIARPIWFEDHKAIYMDGLRPHSRRVTAMERWRDAEQGSLGVAVLVRPDWVLEDVRVVSMGVLPMDRTRRVALVVDLTVEGLALSVVGTHMAHIHFGAHRNWAELRRALRGGGARGSGGTAGSAGSGGSAGSAARPDAVLAGDMNTWSPVVSFFMPGWRRAVRGASWPAWRPHSQIDHILLRGSRLRAVSGSVLPDAGSDHRPVRAELEVV
jgi:endonuclease/exonuclease/phosphatase family metal-dependent hydrolase